MSLYQHRLSSVEATSADADTSALCSELVLLHGWGMNADIWQPWLAQLTEHYTVTLFDLPGLGRSSDAPVPYTFDALATRLLDAAPERAHWLGWSLGGCVATAIAATAPERVTSLTLLASNPCFVQRDDWSCAMAQETFTGFQQALAQDATKTLSRFLMLQTQGGSQAREILRQLKTTLKVGQPTALADSLALLAQDQRGLLSRLACPLLTLWGEQDQLVPVAAAQAVQALNPAAHSVEIAGAGHLPFLSDAEVVLDALRAFTAGAESA